AIGAPYTEAYATGYGPRSATKRSSRIPLGVPSSRTLVKCSWAARYQRVRLRVPRSSKTSGTRRSGRFRIDSQSARVSSLSMPSCPPPAPAGGLARRVPPRGERPPEDRGVRAEGARPLRGKEDRGAHRQEDEEDRQHEPALPGARRPPSPSIALRGEPEPPRG